MKSIKLIIFSFLIFLSFSIKGQDVYKTPSGKKYHLSSCRMVENVSKKLVGESASVQCKGNTQKGTRCKHKTRLANGYCYQHTKQNSSSNYKISKSNSTSACGAKNKSGGYCKRKVKGSGYCHQHRNK